MSFLSFGVNILLGWTFIHTSIRIFGNIRKYIASNATLKSSGKCYNTHINTYYSHDILWSVEKVKISTMTLNRENLSFHSKFQQYDKILISALSIIINCENCLYNSPHPYDTFKTKTKNRASDTDYKILS